MAQALPPWTDDDVWALLRKANVMAEEQGFVLQMSDTD